MPKLPNGATSVPVGANGEHIVVTPGNTRRPPAAEFLKGGRITRLVPADTIATWATDALNDADYADLIDMLDRMSGAPKFAPLIERRDNQ